MATEIWSDRLEKVQSQIKKSQDDLKAAQENLQNKIGSLENLSFLDTDLNKEIERISEQMQQERINNSKLSTELAKSLELNLKLQFEMEEIRCKANQVLSEEKKHNQYLQEKNKSLLHELELAQAMCDDTRSELVKARDKFQEDLKNKESEIEQLSNSMVSEFETHSNQQQDLLKNLSTVAEKKIIELKMGLDKKTAEAQDYYSHLQQALSQLAVSRQESSALKDYISKLTQLHKQS